MSNSSGKVTFKKDGLVMWCEYQGASDVMVPQLFDTREEMRNNWRNGSWKECSCDSMEPVEIYSDYGPGFTWDGEACRTCKAINHEHLDQHWKEDKEYREQRNNPWGWS